MGEAHKRVHLAKIGKTDQQKASPTSSAMKTSPRKEVRQKVEEEGQDQKKPQSPSPPTYQPLSNQPCINHTCKAFSNLRIKLLQYACPLPNPLGILARSHNWNQVRPASPHNTFGSPLHCGSGIGAARSTRRRRRPP